MRFVFRFFSPFFILFLVFWGCSSSTESEPEQEPEPGNFELLTDGRWKLAGTLGVDTISVRGNYKYNSDYTGAVYCVWEDTVLCAFTWGLEDNDEKLVYTRNSITEHATIQKLTETEMNLFWIERNIGHYYTKVVEE